MLNIGRIGIRPLGLAWLLLFTAGVGEAQTTPTPQSAGASVPPPPVANPAPVAAQKAAPPAAAAAVAAPAPAQVAQVAASVQVPPTQPVAVSVPGQTVVVQQSAPTIYIVPAPAPTVTMLAAPTSAAVHAQPTLTGFVTPPAPAPVAAAVMPQQVQQVQYLVAAPQPLYTYAQTYAPVAVAPVAATAVPPASAASPLLVEAVPAGVLGRIIGGFGTRLTRFGYARVPYTTATTTTTTTTALVAAPVAPKHQWLHNRQVAVAPVYAQPVAPVQAQPVDDSGWDPRFTEPLMQSVRPTPQVQTKRRLFGH